VQRGSETGKNEDFGMTIRMWTATAAAFGALVVAQPAAHAQMREFRAYYPGPVYSAPDFDELRPAPPRRVARYELEPDDDFGPDEPIFPPPRRAPRLDFEPAPRRDRGALEMQIDRQEQTAQLVRDPTGERPGTIVVDTASRKLYLVYPGGEAIRYGIGVGRQGFAWKGAATIGRKAEWPSWTPPTAMLKRRPDLPTFMEGGLDNPLGARALYLHSGGRDTLFRIHGTNEPDTIGQAVSSGCIRMMNADVIDLYSRVRTGTRVVVR
jgi:lipoprotein-anchoring transpeptidase ErfK/SrfK